MKRKLFSVFFALVLVLSLSLVTAVPVAAQETITISDPVDATIIRTDTLDAITFDIEILSENVPHGVYGVGVAFATSLDQPAFQVWYAEAGNIPPGYTEYGWYYQDYGTGWNGEVTLLADKTGFSATERERTEKTFSISVPTAELGGFGATYYYAVQVRTNLINSYPEGWGWGSPVSAYASVKLLVLNEDTGKLYGTIQAAIDAASGTTLVCAPGTYDEDVTIDKDLTLVSAEGKDNTIINGQSTGYTGAVKITADNVVLGGDGTGFTINGSGQAAVYFTQSVSGCLVEGNDVVAASGKNALVTEGGQSNHTITDNTFSGDPASQLVYVNGMASVSVASTSVNFIGNTFAGTATGPALGQEAADSTISGNTFATVTGYASLELWGDDNIVTGNDFTADLPAGGVYVLDNTGTLDIAAALVDNTFLRAVVVDHEGASLLPKIWAYIQDAVNEAVSGDTISVAAGTYNEQVVIDKQLTLNGANADVNAVTGTRGSESIIDGGTSTAITISADGVIVDGFTLDGGITLDDLVNSISGGTISNNIITGADNPEEPIKAQNGIRVGFDNNGKGVNGITIENNTISNSREKGIRFSNTKLDFNDPHDPQRISNITISGNEIKDNGSAGIETYGPGPNTIINNIISGNAGNGMNLKFGSGDVVTGNIITNNTGPGITLRQATDTTVENNSVSGHQSEDVIKTCDTVPGGKGSGIHIFDASEDNTIRFNDISGNNYGIFIHSKGDLQPSGNSINFNNIYGNINYGILNALVDPLTSVDATNNWWGTKAGGLIKQMVSDNVDYDPWIGAGVKNSKSKKTAEGDDTVNGKDKTDTDVLKKGKGKPNITVTKYTDNPGDGAPGGFTSAGKYIDVHINDTTDVDEIEIRNYYTLADIVGLNEASLRLSWWNGTAWIECSHSGATYPAGGPTYRGYVWAIIKATGTTPTLDDMAGTAFMPMGVKPAAGGGGGGPPPAPTGTTDVRGIVTTAGVFTSDTSPTSKDGLCTLTIPKGTVVGLTEEVEPLTEISMLVMDEPPPPPEEGNVIGLAYDFQPSGATFDLPITLTFSYDPADIPEGIAEGDLVSAFYDEAAGEWIELEGCVVDPETNTITASVSHFTTFAVVFIPVPAAFIITGLEVSPAEVEISGMITIRALVENTGGMKGINKVTLKINGEVEQTKYVVLGSGASARVSFIISRDVAGSYSVEINGLTGSFTVKAPPELAPSPAPPAPAPPAPVPPAKPINWPVLGAIIAGVVIPGLSILFLARRRAY